MHVFFVPRADFRARADILVLVSVLDSSYLKTQELTIKLWKIALVHPWSKPRTFQSSHHMLRADHLNIDGPTFPVKCVRKFRSALGGEVTHRGT